MTDFASVGVIVDSTQVIQATKAFDSLADSAAKVEPKIDGATKAVDSLGASSANVWRRGADVQRGLDAISESSGRMSQRITVTNGQMGDTTKLMQIQAEQAKAVVASTNQLTLGQQQLIEKYREQAATIGMSRSQLMAYQAAQMGVTAETEKAVAAVKAHEDVLKAASKAKDDAAKSSNVLSDALKILAAGYAALKIGEYIKDSAMLAARYETLGVVLEVVGRNAGYTKTQMDAAADGIARQGITMLESRNSAVKLVQAHVDLANASGLARIAQDAAVIGNINSSEAFDRMVNGISRGNVLILRNIGINVNLQSAYAQMADTLGKSTKELSENERVQARLNAVLERGQDIAGTYEAAMGTAGKQILSMQRYTEDLKVKIGETFAEVLTVAVMAFTDRLKDSNHEVSELSKNGQLAEWGRDLTSIFVGVANAIDNIMTGAKMAGTWAAHQSAGADINSKYDKMAATAPKMATMGGQLEQGERIERERQRAFAKEQSDYEAAQITLGATVDRFQRSADERSASRTAKLKSDADVRLKVDQDYASKAAALLAANAGKSLEIQQAAQAALAKSVYVGTPTYRDTEGRAPKPKVDQAENTKLADQIARFESEASATKQHLDDLARLDDMYHRAGELSDKKFYDNKHVYVDSAAKAQVDAYQKEMDALKAHANQTPAEVQKTQKQINDIYDKQTSTRERAAAENYRLNEEERLQQKAIQAASDEANNKYISGLDAQAKAIEIANGKHEQSASAIADETAAQFRLAAAAMAVQAAGPVGGDHTQADADAAAAMLITLNLQADAQERIARALRDGEAANASRKLADQQINDWKNVGASVADSLSNAFGAAGKAAGAMFKAYADNMARQGQLNKEMVLAKAKLDSDPTKLKAISDIQSQSAQAQLKSYGDMADAAQGFFEQGSKGYAAMGAAAQVMHAAEVALSLVKGVNAVLTQGEGDPYSAFARMAAMSAMVVGLGVALSGGGSGGGGQSAADVQKTQGTGSVFGDSTAKSDSIARSIALASANSSIELTHTAGMLAALNSIQASMSGLANLIVRTPGVTDGSNMGIQTGTLSRTGSGSTFATAGAVAGGVASGAYLGSMVGSFLGPLGAIAGGVIGSIGGAIVGKIASLWGNTKQNVVDSGLQFGGSVRSLQSGQGFNQYASVDTTKSSWFGLSKSTSNSVQTQGIGNELSSQFGLVFTNLETSLKAAAVGLGGSAAQVSNTIDHLTLSTSKISLKGLTGDALTSAINGVMSKAMDDMAQAALPGYDRFRKVGEGYSETVTRVSTDFVNVGSIFESMGKSLVTTSASSSRIFGGWLGQVLNAAYGNVASTLPRVTTLSVDARERLIELAGGIDKMASQANSFTSNYLSEAERLAPVTKYVTDQMAALGYSSVNTRDQFKNLVLGLDVSTQKGAEQYTALMALSDAFAKTHAATVDLTLSTQAVADERKNLQDQLDQLTMSSTQLLTKQRNALDASNRGIFDQIQAAQKLKDANDAAKTSLGNVITSMKSFADATKAYGSGLVTGSLSTLTPAQQYAETKRQFDKNVAAAKGGDVGAQGNYQSLATAFLTASQKVNSSDSQYAADFAGVLQTTDEMSKWAAGQVDVAQASLDALNAQVAGIGDLNTTMLSVAQGIANLPSALSAAPINPANYGGSDSLPTLVAAVKSLQAANDSLTTQIAGLRADQQKQTGSLIAGNDQSQQANADAIVTGIGGLVGRVISTSRKAMLE